MLQKRGHNWPERRAVWQRRKRGEYSYEGGRGYDYEDNILPVRASAES